MPVRPHRQQMNSPDRRGAQSRSNPELGAADGCDTIGMQVQTSPTPRERALRHVAALSTGGPVDPGVRVTLNFHPDRLSGGRTILDWLAADGSYVSQFVTGTSNGGLTAHPGGDRWRWESRIFGGAYDDAPAH